MATASAAQLVDQSLQMASTAVNTTRTTSTHKSGDENDGIDHQGHSAADEKAMATKVLIMFGAVALTMMGCAYYIYKTYFWERPNYKFYEGGHEEFE